MGTDGLPIGGIIYGGRDKDGRGYFALFPVGGTIREFLGRDRVIIGCLSLLGLRA